MEPVKWECDALDNSNEIFLMHNGRELAAQPVYHDFIMIAYIAHGEGVHHCGDKDIKITEGDIFIVNPNFTHYFIPSSRTKYIELYYCFFTKKKAELAWRELKVDFPDLEPFFNNTSIKYLHINDSSNKEIRSIFVRMIDEFMHCPAGNKSVINGYFIVMLTTLLRRYQFAINNPVFNRNKTVDEVIRYINYNLNFDSKVCDIAEALNMSQEHLCRLFKKHTGTTIKQFVTYLKIEKIKDWLKNTDRSIESIYITLNCNQIYINRLFKKHTGMTLLEYRKKYHYKA